MNVEAASQQLIHEILAVIVGEVLSGIDNSMHIGFHEVSNNIDIFIPCHGWWLLHVDKSNNVLMIKEFYITKTRNISKWINFPYKSYQAMDKEKTK